MFIKYKDNFISREGSVLKAQVNWTYINDE